MKIAIDFDGTCVTNEFPGVGKDIGAVPVLKRLIGKGHKFILYTLRTNEGKHEGALDTAKAWFQENGIELWAIGKDRGQEHWNSSNKCFADLYIDKLALGIPLKIDTTISSLPFVDWDKIEILVETTIRNK